MVKRHLGNSTCDGIKEIVLGTAAKQRVCMRVYAISIFGTVLFDYIAYFVFSNVRILIDKR